uniref:Uncharacterized protein n=1 Tax=Lotharella oceanica TaxID=641309 RepID=A0A7S2THR3_9EUKA|mmetsp:Transcript_14766/g.28055  ORF Transcript_14766/g.28055 Transcript_14766/m.28055 type:complete len:424 (+) Transcript_14766:54-1325(+)
MLRLRRRKSTSDACNVIFIDDEGKEFRFKAKKDCLRVSKNGTKQGSVYGVHLDISGNVLNDGFNQIPIANCKEAILPQLALLCRETGVTGLEEYVPATCTTVVGTMWEVNTKNGVFVRDFCSINDDIKDSLEHEDRVVEIESKMIGDELWVRHDLGWSMARTASGNQLMSPVAPTERVPRPEFGTTHRAMSMPNLRVEEKKTEHRDTDEWKSIPRVQNDNLSQRTSGDALPRERSGSSKKVTKKNKQPKSKSRPGSLRERRKANKKGEPMTQSSKDVASFDLNSVWPQEDDNDLWWVSKKSSEDSKHTVDSCDTSHGTMKNVSQPSLESIQFGMQNLTSRVPVGADPKTGDIFGTLARRRSAPDLHTPISQNDKFAASANGNTTLQQRHPKAPEWAEDVIVNPFEQLEKLGAGQIQRTPFDAD